MHTVIAPWSATLTPGEHSLIFYFLVVAGLAVGAYSLKSWGSRNEVSSRYRPAVLASTCITGVAFVSYIVLVIKFDVGYNYRQGNWYPNTNALLSWSPRYMDWSVTVPLLIIELIAVSALAGAAARRMRSIGVVAAAAMIVTGYIGGVVIDNGESLPALWIWGIISSIFFIILYFVVLYTVIGSKSKMSAAAYSSYRNAMILLLVVWFVYPIVFGFQGFTHSGAWTASEQILLSLADIIAKVGFGVIIHKIAKLRTAEDVASGVDTMPESIWISSVKESEGMQPPIAHSSEHSSDHFAADGVRVGRRDERRAEVRGTEVRGAAAPGSANPPIIQ